MLLQFHEDASKFDERHQSDMYIASGTITSAAGPTRLQSHENGVTACAAGSSAAERCINEANINWPRVLQAHRLQPTTHSPLRRLGRRTARLNTIHRVPRALA